MGFRAILMAAACQGGDAAGGVVIGPECITNGDFASAGPPPTLTGVGPPVIAAGQLVFDQDGSGTGRAAWTSAQTLTPGTYRINITDVNLAGGTNILRVGGSSASSGGTTLNLTGSRVDFDMTVGTVIGQIISITDSGNSAIYDNFSVKRIG